MQSVNVSQSFLTLRELSDEITKLDKEVFTFFGVFGTRKDIKNAMNIVSENFLSSNIKDQVCLSHREQEIRIGSLILRFICYENVEDYYRFCGFQFSSVVLVSDVEVSKLNRCIGRIRNPVPDVPYVIIIVPEVPLNTECGDSLAL